MPRALEDELPAVLEQARGVEGFRGLHLIELSETEIVTVVLTDDQAALDRIGEQVGSPFIRRHLGGSLAGPPQRRIGRVLGSTDP